MKIIFERGKEGLRVLRCFGYDGQAEIPEQIGGEPVTEIGAYAFSETFRGRNAGDMYQSEVLDEAVSSGGGRTRFPAESFGCVERAEKPAASFGCGERAGKPAAGSGCGVDWKAWNGELAGMQCLEDGTPVLSGSRLRSVRLPSGLKEIGRYAFYNCENLNHLTAFGTLRDLGAGLFTGCYGISLLDIYVVQGQKSCLKEILSELRQTLRLNYRDEQGEIRAKLLFPEFFEESVENTPARILMREMHGCGHMYRNAFSGTEFQFLTYDKLFPHVQVQEQPVLVTELVMGRLQYPCQMAETARKNYEEYAASHGREILQVSLGNQDMELLRFAGGASWCSAECMDQMLEEAGKRGNPQALGILMDIRHRKRQGGSDGDKGGMAEETGNAGKGENTGEALKPSKRKRRFEW